MSKRPPRAVIVANQAKLEPDGSGTFLTAWRKHRKLSQEKLGEAAGYTQGMISQLEIGTVQLNMEHLRKLSDALDITSRQLQFRHPAAPETADDIMDDLPEPDAETFMLLGRSLRDKAQKP